MDLIHATAMGTFAMTAWERYARLPSIEAEMALSAVYGTKEAKRLRRKKHD
jgi:hypothetical protein